MLNHSIWAWSVPVRNAPQRLVLLALADQANAEHICWPSQLTIAERTRLSERTVRGALKELEGAGVIRREAHFDALGHRSSDRIKLLLPNEAGSALKREPASSSNSPEPSGRAGIQPSVSEFGLDAPFEWEPMPRPGVRLEPPAPDEATTASRAGAAKPSSAPLAAAEAASGQLDPVLVALFEELGDERDGGASPHAKAADAVLLERLPALTSDPPKALEVTETQLAQSHAAALFLDWAPAPPIARVASHRQELIGAGGASCRVNSLTHPTIRDKEDSDRQDPPPADVEPLAREEALRAELVAILAGHGSPALGSAALPPRLLHFGSERAREAAAQVAERLRRTQPRAQIRSWYYLVTVLEKG